MRPLARSLARALLGVVVLWALTAVVALAVGGFFVPPVVQAASDPDWTLSGSGYPADTALVECTTSDGVVLRGLLVPSDSPALVVHFAESGSSVTQSYAFHGQYGEYARRGFRSLIVDYRGLGLSEGAISSAEFELDVAAIYALAKTLVGGDESMIVLRGCSLGTVAVACALHERARPAGIIAIAPVEASEVALRFTDASAGLPVSWLARPFLRPFIAARTIATLCQASAPTLVLAHPHDPLLARDDFERLQAAAGAKRLELSIPVLERVPWLAQGPLDDHIFLSLLAFSLTEVEVAFVDSLMAAVPPVAARVESILAGGPRELVDAVAAHPAHAAALAQLAKYSRGLDPKLVLAVSLGLTAEEVPLAEGWITAWQSRPAEAARSRPATHLVQAFDLDDAGGRLPVEAVLAAARGVQRPLPTSGGSVFLTADEVLGLASALFGDATHGRVHRVEVRPDASSALGPGPGMQFWIEANGILTSTVVEGGRTRRGRPSIAAPLREALGLAGEELGRDEQRRLLKCYLRAAWHEHDVELDERGSWRLVDIPVEQG